MNIFTIGYEGATQAEVLAALSAAGVELLVDVRAVPLSRRPGFSKTVLQTGFAKSASTTSTSRRWERRPKGARRRASMITRGLRASMQVSLNCQKRSRRSHSFAAWPQGLKLRCCASNASRVSATGRCRSRQPCPRRRFKICL